MTDFGLDKSYVALPHVLIRADKKEKDVVYMEASNIQTDSQDEVVLRKALEDEAERFLKRGVISWNHGHKLFSDPGYLIGEPMDVKFTDDNCTLVKARIYTTCKYGKSVLDLAKAKSTRLGASVGGFIVKRAEMFDAALNKAVSAIAKIIWDEVAITHQAINEATTSAGGGHGVSIIPFPEFAKAWGLMEETERQQILKALMAGYGTDAATMTGGRALIPESLQGARKKKRKKLKGVFVDVLHSIQGGRVKNYSDLDKMFRSRGLNEDAVRRTARLVTDRTQQIKTLLARR